MILIAFFVTKLRQYPSSKLILFKTLKPEEQWSTHATFKVQGASASAGLLYIYYTLSEAWSGVNWDWADLMAAQGAFGSNFYDRSILRPKHRAYNRSGGPIFMTGLTER